MSSARAILADLRSPPRTSVEEVDATLADVGKFSDKDVVRALGVLEKTSGHVNAAAYRLSCLAFVGLVRKNRYRSLFVPFVKMMKRAQPDLKKVLYHVLPWVNDPKHHAELCALLKKSHCSVPSSARATWPKCLRR